MEAIELIVRALRLIGQVAAGEAPEAEEAQDSLDTLNSLFAEWRGSDIAVPDYNVPTVASTLSIDRADKDAVAYQLALRMSPEFGVSVSPEFRQAMDEAFSRFRLRYFQPGTTDLSEIPFATGDYRPYDIDFS
jgi:hypothetical protein